MEDFLRYIPHTEEDRRKMFEAIGVEKIDDLLETVPEAFRLSVPLNLPEPMSEPDVVRYLKGFQSQIFSSFLGGGAYHHFIPAVVSALTSRSEFFTA
jgi:glycine dehydrogenase subunit 1